MKQGVHVRGGQATKFNYNYLDLIERFGKPIEFTCRRNNIGSISGQTLSLRLFTILIFLQMGTRLIKR